METLYLGLGLGLDILHNIRDSIREETAFFFDDHPIQI